MKKVRLLHTSDVHLGDPSGHPRSPEALASVVDAVRSQNSDILLLVGDVFDNERVTDDVLLYFVRQMSRLDVPAVVLPGNHDLVHESSVYRRAPFNDKPENLFVLEAADGETLSFPELGLELWGRAMSSHTPAFQPLAGIPPPTEGHWLVGLAHGHFHFEYDRDQRSSPIYPQDVEDATCHYLALGHWDRHVNVSRGNVTAVYSGCPLGPIGQPDKGEVTVVDLDPVAGVSYRQAALRQSESINGR